MRNLPVTARGMGLSSSHTPAQPRQIPLAEVADVAIVEGPATIKSENGLLRNYVRLNVHDRDAVDLVAGLGWQWPKRPSFPMASSSDGRASSSTRPCAADIDPGRAARGRLDLPGALSDLSRPGGRRADDAGRAGRDRRRTVLPVALGLEALGHGLGRLHRLFRHGDLDRHHHAGLPPRSRCEGRRTGADRPGRHCGRPS